MPQVQKTQYTRVTFFINTEGAGWTENYALVDDSALFTGIPDKATTLATYRQWLLPATASIEEIRLSQVLKPASRITRVLLTAPLAGTAGTLTTAVAGDANRPEDALWFRFDGSAGQRETRCLRGVPDVLIATNAFTVSPPAGGWIDVVGLPADATTNPGTYQTALKNFLSFLVANYKIPSKRQTVTIGGSPVQGYNLDDIANIKFQRVRGHKTGRPFGLSVGRRRSA